MARICGGASGWVLPKPPRFCRFPVVLSHMKAFLRLVLLPIPTGYKSFIIDSKGLTVDFAEDSNRRYVVLVCGNEGAAERSALIADELPSFIDVTGFGCVGDVGEADVGVVRESVPLPDRDIILAVDEVLHYLISHWLCAGCGDVQSE